MITKIEGKEDFISDLKDLLHLDYAVVEVYEIGIKKVKNKKYKNKLNEFKTRHYSSIHKISSFLKKNGHEAPTGPGVEKFLIQGKPVLKNIMDDMAILKVLKNNERDMSRASQNINMYNITHPDFKKNLSEKYENEKKHVSWFEKELQNKEIKKS